MGAIDCSEGKVRQKGDDHHYLARPRIAHTFCSFDASLWGAVAHETKRAPQGVFTFTSMKQRCGEEVRGKHAERIPHSRTQW